MQLPSELPAFLQAIPPKRERVAENVWMLSNPGYNEVVAEMDGEIYVFDATQSEGRARLDHEAIKDFFPDKKRINVVVSDLAWPHIAGVRYWVSQGATIIAHSAARSFLERVIERRWTLKPDSLEHMRLTNPKSVHFTFVPVDRPTRLAQGRVVLLPIDGIASEVTVMAYLTNEKFLWGSDYIQTVDSPSQYAQEVIAAADGADIRPDRAAAEHMEITPWSVIVAAQKNNNAK